MERKSDAVACFKHFYAHCQSQQHTIRHLKCDNDSVLNLGGMLEFLQEKGIEPINSPPYDPQAGGRHESVIGVLWEHVIATLKAAPHVPTKYWPFILETICQIRNNMVHSSTKRIPAITAHWIRPST